ncbi:hypothetical protein AEST_02990 [Alishewanella aestuarii B11]|uniref:Secreted protein n=1 Tax=Alishewanella aestuarii B11 TaxID=1197174 RepID=J1Q6D5_9ALTE|nr:hypothetical protein [Alishewanella aestuarii]EJI86753.1 hypothetical protein AEST_02990 [Alishewanella aestuarii B11]
MSKAVVLALLSAGLFFSVSKVQAVSAELQCQLQVPAAVHGTSVWYQMGYPFNLTANNLGLLPGSTLYQMAEQAFGLWQQGVSETAVMAQVSQRCASFSAAELNREYSFFEEEGNTPTQLTACGDMTTTVVQSFANLDGQPFTLNNLKIAIIGDEHKPAIEQIIVHAFNLKQQGQLETAILEQTFAYCQQQSTEFKQQLAAEFYAE